MIRWIIKHNKDNNTAQLKYLLVSVLSSKFGESQKIHNFLTLITAKTNFTNYKFILLYFNQLFKFTDIYDVLRHLKNIKPCGY